MNNKPSQNHFYLFVGALFLYQVIALTFNFKTVEEFKTSALIIALPAAIYFVFIKIFKVNKTGPIPIYASPVIWGIIIVAIFVLFSVM